MGCLRMIQLSRRLQQIADQIPAGSRVADIGSDHALLPAYLIERSIASQCIAGEVNQGPYKAAKKQVAMAGLSSHIQVRLGNGLTVIQAGEADVITIAGMGGHLICTILESGLNQLRGVQRMILQPNVGEDAVRRWLHAHEWFLEDEFIIHEDGKIYEVLVASPLQNSGMNEEAAYDKLERFEKLYEARIMTDVLLTTDLLYRMGPYLLDEASDVFQLKWKGEIAKLVWIMDQQKQSESEDAKQKLSMMLQHKKQLEEVLACLPKVKP